ncbi:aminopeptidase P N-terminal domain-containing protein [Gemmatimonadota bacterium]
MTTHPRELSRPMAGFSPEVFRRRREQVWDVLDGGALLLPAATSVSPSQGTALRYRPDRELFYLTGWIEAGALALLRDRGAEHPFVFFMPPRDPKKEVWTGPRLGPEEAWELLGADAVFPLSEAEERLPNFLKGSRCVFYRLGTQPLSDRLVGGILREARAGGARKGLGPRSVVDPGEILDELRLRKDPGELTRIRAAAALTVAGFREAVAQVREGTGEWEIESALEGAFRRGGAGGPAFPTIVGSGPNACYLHYRDNHATLVGGQMVLLDGGAELGLYAGDVTRTFPVNGIFDATQRSLYEVVLDAHDRAVAGIRPGVTVAEVHRIVRRALTEGLVATGVLKGGLHGLLESKAVDPFFPHQTSHWLGLDVHDVGDYVVAGTSRVLEAGMVLTVEPGLYFGPDPARSQTPFEEMGVRIENDILVTEEGSENLTGSLPVDPDEIEAMLRP